MNTNSSVILYHYDDKTGEETVYNFRRANVHGEVKIGDLSHGRRAESRFTVRIPTNDEIKVSCGDKIYCEKFGDLLTVTGYADNRRSSRYIRHWKLIVK